MGEGVRGKVGGVYLRVPGAGQGGAEGGSPTPHTFSSTPTPQSPPPRAVRAETLSLSPARLPGDTVGPSSTVAIARAMPMTRPATPIVIIIIIRVKIHMLIDGTAFSIFAHEENNNNR